MIGKIQSQDLRKIQRLVGEITLEDLEHVDAYVSDRMGIFIPSVGFCQYAIRPSHTHPSYSFVIFFSKEQCFFEDAIELPKEHYLATMIEPGIPHEEKPSETFHRYVAIFISKEYYEGLCEELNLELKPYTHEWKQFAVGHEIMVYIKKFMNEYEMKITGYEQVLESLEVVITHELVRHYFAIGTNADVCLDPYEIQGVIEMMHQHFADKITLLDLSKKVNMSLSNFIRSFKKETGLSPMEYLIRIRIDKAKKFLRSGTKSITEVSLLCGFGSISHFSSCFSRHTGVTPTKYRSGYKENKI